MRRALALALPPALGSLVGARASGRDLEPIEPPDEPDPRLERLARAERQPEAPRLAVGNAAVPDGTRLEADLAARPRAPSAVDDADEAEGGMVAGESAVFLDRQDELRPRHLARGRRGGKADPQDESGEWDVSHVPLLFVGR